MGTPLIRLHSPSGNRIWLNPDAIARITEAGVSGKWHGINSYIKTFDGMTIEVRETQDEVVSLIKDKEQQ